MAPRAPPAAGRPSARATMAAWPPALPSSITTPAMPRACQSSNCAGPRRRTSRMAPVTSVLMSLDPSSVASSRPARSSRSARRSRRYGSAMRRMRARKSLATRCTAASAVRPPCTASATRRSQPSSAATARVASSMSRGASPAPSRNSDGSWASISMSSPWRISPSATCRRASSALGSSASSWFGARLAPCSLIWPKTMPGESMDASNCRGRLPAKPSRVSDPPAASRSVSSMATVSSTSVSYSV